MPVLPEVGSMMTEPDFVQHGFGDAVLGGPAGVEALQLPQDAGAQAQLPLKMRQLQQGRPPDQLIY